MKKEPNRNWALDLSYNCRISFVGYHHLADILSSAITIAELFTANNTMNEAARASLLNGLRNNKTLRKFSIQMSELNDQDTKYIRHFIRDNPALKEIDLYRCQINDDGAAHLAEGLSQSGLEKLNISL
jgi:Ran GTPase-activating protein (RanGAP) involved in mRNA processing and transport